LFRPFRQKKGKKKEDETSIVKKSHEDGRILEKKVKVSKKWEKKIRPH